MQMLPALAEADIVGFGNAVAEVQRSVGAHFASVQGGVYSSSAIARVMHWLSQRGAVSAGQSSWGPTGFALFESEAGACRALEDARGRWAEATELEFHLCRARNTPAEIEIEPVECDRTSETQAYFEGRQVGMS
jgi:predicted sugar kinase